MQQQQSSHSSSTEFRRNTIRSERGKGEEGRIAETDLKVREAEADEGVGK